MHFSFSRFIQGLICLSHGKESVHVVKTQWKGKSQDLDSSVVLLHMFEERVCLYRTEGVIDAKRYNEKNKSVAGICSSDCVCHVFPI